MPIDKDTIYKIKEGDYGSTVAQGLLDNENKMIDAINANENKNIEQDESINISTAKNDSHDYSIQSLQQSIDNGGHTKAISMNVEDNYKICNFPIIIWGEGVPSENTIPLQEGIPAFIGQLYINTSADTGGLYYAVDTVSISSWRKC